jgi:hypothetical protein
MHDRIDTRVNDLEIGTGLIRREGAIPRGPRQASVIWCCLSSTCDAPSAALTLGLRAAPANHAEVAWR